ncbi:MAG: HYR domain-containing protein [Ignavibacteriae bacterium]|nr:HYR domain-containing protein [Ignavibacteriota bacterium]
MKNITNYMCGTVLANLCVEKAVFFVLCLLLFGATVQPLMAQSCNAPDNGSGSANLPADCPYIAPMDVMRIIDGLPAGTTIECAPTFQNFTGITRTPGGSLGGEVQNFSGVLNFVMAGKGGLTGFNRNININLTSETHVGPRTPGTSPQSFDATMNLLQGQIIGDPDFDLLRITAGTGFGLPSPGHFDMTSDGGGWAISSFFDITYRIDFVGASGGALAGHSGSTTATIRWQQGMPSSPSAPEFQFSTNHLPPLGQYSTQPDTQIMYPGSAVKAKNWLVSNFRTSTSPPSLGNNINWDFHGTGSLQLSTDGGSSFFDVFTEFSAMVNINHTSDNGDTQVFDTEMLSLSLTGGTLPSGIMLRESPTRASTGKTTIRPASSSGFMISSFFDVFTELSLDGGSTWIPADKSNNLQLMERTTPNNSFGTLCVTPSGGEYQSKPGMFSSYGTKTIKDVILKNFSSCDTLPALGNSSTVTGTGSASFKQSDDGGNSFFDVFTEVSLTVHVTHSRDEGSAQVFDTEMLALNIYGGTIPDELIRESPTLASRGRLRATPGAGSDWNVDSFFDIFTELSVDGGATWSPANLAWNAELLLGGGGGGGCVDTLSPTVMCPADIEVATTNPAGAVVTYSFSAFDECDTNLTLTSNPPSGSTFPVGVTTVTCSAQDDAGHSNQCSFTVTVRMEENPPFTENPPPFRDRHICTPLFMNTDNSGSENLWIRAAGGDLLVEFIAHAVNNVDPESAHVSIWDGTTLVHEMGVGYTAAEAASMPEFEKAVSVTLPGVAAGTLFRFEVTTPPPTPSTQPHYRFELDGVVGAAINSPTWRSFEEQYARWYVYVGAENQLDVDFFTTGVPTPATNGVIRIVTPGGLLHPASGPTAITGATEVSISPATPGMWMIEIPFIDGHYRLNKLSGADKAIYVGGATGGRGHKRIVIHRNDKLDTSVAYSVKARMRVAGQEGDVWQDMDSTASQNGIADFDKLPQGYFSFEVTPTQPGISKPDTQFDSLFCDSIVVDTFKTRTLPGTIHGYKVNDKNGNGSWDVGESGIPNWWIFISDVTSYERYSIDSMQTDSTGYFEFSNLEPGEYEVMEQLRDGWTPTGGIADIVEIVGGDTADFVYFFNKRTNGNICINKYFDINHNQEYDEGEPPMGNVAFTVSGGGNVYTDETNENGQVCFEVDARVPLYTITEIVPDGWTVSFPKGGTMELVPFEDSTVTITWLNAPSQTDSLYRSHTYEEWAHELSKDEKGKLLAVKCKPDAVKFKFNLIVYTDTLKMKFNMKTNGQAYLGKGKTVPFDTGWVNTKDVLLIFSGAAHPGDTIQIDGIGVDGKAIKVDYQWLTLSGGRTKSVKKGTLPSKNQLAGDTIKFQQLLLPMPNLVNVGEELYRQQQFPFTTGAPSDSHSVVYLKYQDVQKSLVKVVKNEYVVHDTTPRCLDKFDGRTPKPISKQQKSLPPDKHNNSLYAQVLTLQLNVMASESEKFPTGYGQLIYDNHKLMPGPLDGLTIDSILSLSNQFLACTGNLPGELTAGDLADVLSDINGAFSGPIDTLVWNCSKIMLTGAKPLKQVTFLRASAPGTGSVTKREPAIVTYQQPAAFMLHQNYPNPFNPTTTIRFDLPEDAVVTLKIYNSLGQEVASILDREEMYEGEQEVDFDATSLPSGVYMYRIVAERMSDDDEVVSGPNFFSVKKMVLMK